MRDNSKHARFSAKSGPTKAMRVVFEELDRAAKKIDAGIDRAVLVGDEATLVAYLRACDWVTGAVR